MNHMKKNKRDMLITIMVISILVAIVMPLTGCQTNQSGVLTGAGIGALAGQAIGGDTRGTVTGAAIGAGAGYILGRDKDQ